MSTTKTMDRTEYFLRALKEMSKDDLFKFGFSRRQAVAIRRGVTVEVFRRWTPSRPKALR